MSSSRTDRGTVEVTMPQMGVSVAEGTIVSWAKHPGDWVEADETVCEVTTDKVDVEIPSPERGRFAEILVGEGETVAVGTPIARIDTAAVPGQAHDSEGKPETASVSDSSRGSQQADRSRFYSPVVQRMAAEHAIDLDAVEGTGVGGRVRKRDLVAYLDAERERMEREEPAPEPPLHTESPYQESGSARRGGEAREAMSPMRAQIARHMVESVRTAAHCTTITEADMSAVTARRAELKPRFEARGVALTYLAFVAHATVEGLQEHPILNASIEGEEIVYHDEVNLGVAVALDGGLIVPVIRNAERLNLEGLAAGIADVARRAREGGLVPDDVHGGTFTITNPGRFGAILATPIINQPQVAILDLEAIVKRVVVDDEDRMAIRPMTYLCMSWDHRALDGAVAARFLGDVKRRLEAWE